VKPRPFFQVGFLDGTQGGGHEYMGGFGIPQTPGPRRRARVRGVAAVEGYVGPEKLVEVVVVALLGVVL
jgi:hypothetical protein